MDGVQVICARNATRHGLNAHLQARLNPDGAKGPNRCKYREGDKIICLKNGMFARADCTSKQEYVANGDQGRIEYFSGRRMVVELSSPRRLVVAPLKEGEVDRDEGDEEESPSNWDLAYACTCHKFQGSECSVVIVVVEPAGKLGSREHLYTALSRARELCIVIADDRDIAAYVRNCVLPDRKTFLRELLTEGA